ILLGGIDASGGLIQRRMGLPDATVLVLQGTLFIVILFFETFYGRFKIFNPDHHGGDRHQNESEEDRSGAGERQTHGCGGN
ncbi:hypothetical protein ACC733_38445, partial [Rhizobium johnstonii]